MIFFRVISQFTGMCGLLSFGHASWTGTPFGSSSDTLIPSKAGKTKKKKSKSFVGFEFDEDFKLL